MDIMTLEQVSNTLGREVKMECEHDYDYTLDFDVPIEDSMVGTCKLCGHTFIERDDEEEVSEEMKLHLEIDEPYNG